MELQQLRYVLAVAEERNFTRAAEKCHVVQSALSHQVKVLEKEIGVQLFARTSRKVELTAAGQAFLPAARASLDAAERAAAEALAASGKIRGKLSLGIIPSVTGLDLPRALGSFHRAYPEVQISLTTGGSDKFMNEIREGALDVAILGLPAGVAPTRVATRVLAHERLVAVVPGSHRLSGLQRLRLEELAHETFADFPTGTPGRAQSDLAFAAVGLPRRVAFEAMSVDLLLDLVGQGLAITLLPAELIPAQRGLTGIAVADGPLRTEYLAWSAFNPSPAALAFLGFIANGLPEAPSGGNPG